MEMTCGIEIHQRLATRHKLFCACPTSQAAEWQPATQIRRKITAVPGELGVVDPAAAFEAGRGRTFHYQISELSECLVEADEEPPHELNREALDTALQAAKMLHSAIVDEVHVMRKMVVDGSATSGFQRTALVALGGFVDTSFGKVGIQTVCLEEESAGIAGGDDADVTYRLDRLGIPLVEIATAPDIHSGAQAREVALKIGELLRSTGKVQRGIGSIRQDLNISVDGGSRVEIKGAQELDLLDKIVENEVRRQEGLNRVGAKMKNAKMVAGTKAVEVTNAFTSSVTPFITKALAAGDGAFAIRLEGFAGVLGIELIPGHRFGTELSSYAKAAAGVGGIIHSDEDIAAKYGLEETAEEAIAKALGCKKQDAWVACIAPSDKAVRALDAVAKRVALVGKGVLKETRRVAGERTEYMRPLPGSARMYPETDVPPVPVSRAALEGIVLPESLGEKAMRFEKMGLPLAMARAVAKDYADSFEDYVRTGADPLFVASTLAETITALRRKGAAVDRIGAAGLAGFFEAFAGGKFTKAAAPVVLDELASGSALAEILLKETLRKRTPVEVKALVGDYRKRNPDADIKHLFLLIIRENRLCVDAEDVQKALAK
jgi:glutamyl-tRNA(Gln) amidotransferase subunit E